MTCSINHGVKQHLIRNSDSFYFFHIVMYIQM